VDLKLHFDQQIDTAGGNIGLNATPLVVGDVVVVGVAHRPAGSPDSTWDVRGYVRGFDARTGKRLWIFHTIPLRGEFGYDTWDDGAADRNGNTGVWAQMSADLELGLVYLPVEMPSADYNGFNRPGVGLFGEALVAVDVRTGERRWHYQTVHHGLWDYDLPCAPILFDMQVDGRTIKALAQPTKSAFLFVLNRETGEPIWPIEERPVPPSDSPFEKTSPTQPISTRPQPFDRQGFSAEVLNDLTPALRAEAEQVMAQYRIGPLYTPPAVDAPGGPLGTLMLPADVGGANWPGGSFDPETNRLYIHSHTAVFTLRNIPADFEPFDPSPTRRAGGSRAATTPPPAGGLGPAPAGLGPPPGPGAARGGTFLQGTIPFDQTAVRSDHGVRHEYGRDTLAEAALHDARQHPQPPRARGARCVSARSLRPHLHRNAHHQRRSWLPVKATCTRMRPAKRWRCCEPTTRIPVRISKDGSRCRPGKPARR
jgi:quinoprotein glucose dehydrogenase